MIFGPILQRELAIAPRRPRLYLYRCLYGVALLILISTAWLVLAGTQVVRCVGDMARFGSILFEVVALLQLALLTFFAAMSAAGAVSQEKDRRTLILLLVTDMTNRELVLGKLASSLTHVLVMVATSLPILMLCVLFGGISFSQVGRVFGVTLCTVCAAGALGNLLAFWREKTFQSLALTVMLICFWLGFWQVVASGGVRQALAGNWLRDLGDRFQPITGRPRRRPPIPGARPRAGGAPQWRVVLPREHAHTFADNACPHYRQGSLLEPLSRSAFPSPKKERRVHLGRPA